MVSARFRVTLKVDSRLLGHNQLIQLGGTILVIPLVPQNAGETFLDELFRDVPR
jgi:hypothetical protein